MKQLYVFTILALATFSFSMKSQVFIDFENAEEILNAEVFDLWEESPFQTGELKGNWAITPNPYKQEGSNSSETVLGAQRSRFGSNRFGVKIDLPQTFMLSPEEKFIHVLIHKPKPGRVMLIGLGSRVERTGQNPFTEQFSVLSSNNVATDKWQDAVFNIRGAEGVEIRSLVIVPDCESPHNLDEDFLFYIDNIQLSDSDSPLINNDYYPVYGYGSSLIANDKKGFQGSVLLNRKKDKQELKINQSDNNLLYQSLLHHTYFAKPGEQIIPEFQNLTEDWDGYCYIDFNRNGYFNFNINQDGHPDSRSELVSFSGNDTNLSKRNKASDHKTKNLKLSPFQIPEDTPPGMYRMRFKLDKNNLNPTGEGMDNQNLAEKGGVIVDVMLFIYSDQSILNDHQLNGEVLAFDGSKLDNISTKSDREFKIKSVPEKGFFNGGVEIIAGYEKEQDEETDKFGNPRFLHYSIPPDKFNPDNSYSIPSDMMRGNLLIKGVMIESKNSNP